MVYFLFHDFSLNATLVRQLNIQYEGPHYQCDEPRRPREAIFYDDADQVKFFRNLRQAGLKTGRQVHAYCDRDTIRLVTNWLDRLTRFFQTRRY